MALDTSKPAIQGVGNYEILTKIAEGGMGTVYKARHNSTGQIVAVKIINPTAAKNTTLLQRFEREFAAAYDLDHPNIVKGIELCAAGVTPYIVMEFVDGESLGQRIDRAGPFGEAEAVSIITQVCEALHRAHSNNLIHRDVKPDNVLLTSDGTAKLTDLGLVKGINDEDMNLTRTGRGLGTPHFMAPEQFRDAKNAGVRCDVYSVGATLYMLVTGKMPFSGTGPLDCWMKKIRNDFAPPRELVPGSSERVNWAILRAMSADPEKRPANCLEFIEDLKGESHRPSAVSPGVANGDTWYLVYRDEENQAHTVKGSTDGIRQALADNLLGDAENIVACRQKQGPFVPLKSHPEFRDLVVSAAPLPAIGSAPPTRTPAPKSGRINMSSPEGAGRSARMPAPSEVSARMARASVGADRPASPITTSGQLPHIDMETTVVDRLGWVMWLLVAGLALSTAAMFYLHFSQR